ncbi:ABC transporter substrate-binding protein [Acetobacterium malicum]|uniref:ABC transporter substrate-binding protein n=1 Tax=Acetobacterium malicum TaxID=52692 RepID=A0ABR6YWN4_9FIRM|nr:ABC transporter substrate-binding protein [Acetobacterium malicum]MBC3899636.1 ABC transporter substrate-binding protein [Acetobacterium malicum]
MKKNLKKNLFKKLGVGMLALMLTVLVMGCANNGKTTSKSGNDMLKLDYSTAFSVEYLDNEVKKLTDADGRILMMIPTGKTVPEEYQDADVIIEGELDRVMLASATQGCMMRALDAVDFIKAVTTKHESWTIAEIADAMKAGTITFVGDNKAPDYEMIKSLDPELVFVYSGDYGLQDMMVKFDELGINYVVCNEYTEEDPRGRMEWIKFYAAFFDKEDQAITFFNEAMKTIETTIKKAEKTEKPKVAWAMVSSGKVYIAENDSYVGKMIEMSGGDYVCKDMAAGSGGITLEEFYATAKDADILIYSSLEQYSPTLDSVVSQSPILANLKAVQDGQVWCLGEDFYQSIDKPDEVISDLFAIFHGDGITTHFKKY